MKKMTFEVIAAAAPRRGLIGRAALVTAALCAASAWADVTAPDFVTNEALFWFDASMLTETAGTDLDSWADVRGGSYKSKSSGLA